MRWLSIHHELEEASFVLCPLLDRKDLADPDQIIIGHAFGWLKKHGLAIQANFVLTPLLARDDLGEQAQHAIQAALDWLDKEENGVKHGLAQEAGFVLHTLLARDDLGDQAQHAIQAAFDWLDKEENGVKHGLAQEAGFVLGPLLAHDDLGKQAQHTIQAAFDWLDKEENGVKHGLAQEARFVLPRLVNRDDLGEQTQRAIQAAFDWLDKEENGVKHGLAQEAGFVLSPLLLKWAGLGDNLKKTIDVAMNWLQLYPNWADTRFVLQRLLGTDLLNPKQRQACSRIAIERLEHILNSDNSDEATFLFRTLLADRNIEESMMRHLLTIASAWIVNHPSHKNLDYVASRILRNPLTPIVDWRRVAVVSIQWLEKTPHGQNRDLLLAGLCIRLDSFKSSARKFLIDDSLHWLEAQDKIGNKLCKILAHIFSNEASRLLNVPDKCPDSIWFDRCIRLVLQLVRAGFNDQGAKLKVDLLTLGQRSSDATMRLRIQELNAS